jgi:hypothetical protein
MKTGLVTITILPRDMHGSKGMLMFSTLIGIIYSNLCRADSVCYTLGRHDFSFVLSILARCWDMAEFIIFKGNRLVWDLLCAFRIAKNMNFKIINELNNDFLIPHILMFTCGLCTVHAPQDRLIRDFPLTSPLSFLPLILHTT